MALRRESERRFFRQEGAGREGSRGGAVARMEKSADHDGGFGFLEFRGGPNEIRFRKRKEIRRATMRRIFTKQGGFFSRGNLEKFEILFRKRRGSAEASHW